MTGGGERAGFLLQGETCWRLGQADRLTVIVDGAEYFRAVKQALLMARSTIMLIGWDFDTRIEFEPEGATLEGPNTLGEFLNWLPENRPEVDIYMLRWDLGVFEAIGRGMVPLAVRPMRFLARNFRFRLDAAHPAGAAHHSKIVVVDDRLAFCGGIDVTAGRWDTREHRDDEPHRTLRSETEPSKPWHDATTAVSGPIVSALGELARERWFRATGERLPPPEDGADLWPDLETTLQGVPVGIARTYPDYNDFPEVREIEALYLRAIARARRTLYIETQYLASARIARAIAERLAEAEGPEIVVVMPENGEGWLRRKPMDGARKRLLNFLWANDPHNRFAAYYPVTAGGAPIYVHAKVMIVDDRLLRIGSSNLNNRSMGFDTECDLAVEAALCDDPEAVGRTILSLRRDLVCEHLGVRHEVYDAALGESGSLIAVIEELRGGGRSLCRLTPSDVEDEGSVLAENELADPEEVEGGVFQRLAEGVRDLVRGAGD